MLNSTTTTNCVFFHPTEIGTGSFKTTQYSEMRCSSSSTIPYFKLYESGTSTFYLSNVINSGEIILIALILIIFVAGLVKRIWDFFLR